jgi:hypothetical protein
MAGRKRGSWMRNRRRQAVTKETLRAQYIALRSRVLAVPSLGDVLVSDLKAPVAHVSTLRFIARQDGLVTLRQLLDRAAQEGAVAFDIDPGKTLARTVEHLLGRWESISVSRWRVATEPNAAPIERAHDVDLRDAIHEFNDAVDALLDRLVQSETSQWLASALDEYVRCMRQPPRHSPDCPSPAIAFTLALRSVRRLAASQERGESTLLADLADAMAVFGERDGRIAQRLVGVGDEPPLTLEAVGAREGVTRERIRQIYKRFIGRAASWTPPALSLFLLQRAVDHAGRYVTAYELSGTLPAGVLSSPRDLQVIDGLLEIRWLKGLVPSKTIGVWVRDLVDVESLEECIRRLRRRANRSLRRWGALDIAEYEDLVRDDGPGFVYHFVLRGRPFDMVGAWIVLREPQTSIFADRTQRISEVVSAISFQRLRKAVKKSLRTLPPDDVLVTCLLRDVAGIGIDNNNICFGTRASARLSRSEVLAQQIVSEHGGATTLKTLQREFVRRGMSAASAGVAYSRSPILERIRYGVVGVVGTTVDAAKIQEVRRQLKREASRSLVGYRRLSDAVELSYKLDPLLVSNTLFLIPRNLIEPGKWTFSGDSGDVIVRQTYVSGLHHAAKACIKAGAVRMTVVFNLGSRTIRVAAL